jgi:hypothetical protein
MTILARMRGREKCSATGNIGNTERSSEMSRLEDVRYF